MATIMSGLINIEIREKNHTNKNTLTFLLITLSLFSILIASKNVSAQTVDADGWMPVIELNEVTTVRVSYKVEANAIKLKYDWEFSRHRGSTYVFSDLTVRYNYSYVPAVEKKYKWIPAKAVIKGWTRKEASKQGFNDDPDHHPTHTTIVTIPVADGTKGFGTTKKFCWNWTSERYGATTPIKPEEGIVYKTCIPAEKDDYGADDPSK